MKSPGSRSEHLSFKTLIDDRLPPIKGFIYELESPWRPPDLWVNEMERRGVTGEAELNRGWRELTQSKKNF